MLVKWAEEEWSYIRNKGVEYREEVLRNMSENVYVGLLANQPVVMFSLFPHRKLFKQETAKMSEYQYYEFCNLSRPLTAEARKEMYSLSSRANVTMHGASYVYNFGDFRGDPKKLILKYFDVSFYISNWGSIQLMFKYSDQQVNVKELKKYCVKHVINLEKQNENILLGINFSNEDGFGWVEGEGMLSDLLPLYDEIKCRNYQILHLMTTVSNNDVELEKPFEIDSNTPLSQAQEAFLKYAQIDQSVFCV